jgi:hypothetical protein
MAEDAKYYLVIESASINGTTGHHTVQVHIERGNERDVPETYGIDSTALQSLYGGDEQKWLASVGREMAAKYIRRQAIQSRLIQMSGQRISVDISG